MIVLFLVFHFVLWLPWWAMANRPPGGLATAERLLQATIFYLAQVIGSVWMLALAGWLKPAILLGGNLALALMLLGGILWSEGWRGLLPRARLRPSPGRGSLRAFNLAAGGLLVLALAFIVLHGIIYPPFTYDDLNYRLPISAWMLQNGGYAITPPQMYILDCYPRSMECWFTWFLAFFRRDTWVDISQLPFLAVCMLALYGVARRLGSSGPAALAGALIFPFAPVVLAQLMTAYADIGYTAFILAALANLLWLREAPGLASRISFGLALGLVLGTKFSGVNYAAVILAFYFLAQWRRGARGRELLAGGLAILLPLLLTGAYAYLRNTLLYGNPVFPYKVALAGFQLPGEWDSDGGLALPEMKQMTALGRIVRSWRDISAVSHSGWYGGFGVTWPFLLLCVAGSLGLAWRRREWPRLELYALIILLFLVTPFNFRTRYVLFLLGLGGLGFAHLFDLAAAARLWRIVLPGVALPICAVAFAMVYRTYWQPLLLLDHRERRLIADPGSHARPLQYREAYRWVRKKMKSRSGRTVYYFGRSKLFAYCLWNERFTSRVVFADPGSEAAFLSLARLQPDSWLFLPPSSRESGWFRVHRAEFVTLFSKNGIFIARWRQTSPTSIPN